MLIVLLDEVVLEANVGVKGRVSSAEWLAWLTMGDLHVRIVRLQLEYKTGAFHNYNVSVTLNSELLNSQNLEEALHSSHCEEGVVGVIH